VFSCQSSKAWCFALAVRKEDEKHLFCLRRKKMREFLLLLGVATVTMFSVQDVWVFTMAVSLACIRRSGRNKQL